ncbi:sigma factor-like helix-turn-helix DNA-binding protein [Actinocorallia aurea]
MTLSRATEDLLRDLTPRVLGALTHRHGRFEACEDAVQEALSAAAAQWPKEGVPENPYGWLLTVASRRLLDAFRSESARRARETALAVATPQSEMLGAAADAPPERDDSLTLLLLCCHPSVSMPSRIALTLRAVGGLTTAQIAAAFLVPEATMAQRISRAKQAIREAGASFALPEEAELTERVRAAAHVLYLVFNEGYTSTSGSDLTAPQLADEAIRLTRMLRAARPGDPEVAGLLALMLLTDARRPARTMPDGDLVPLGEQDRSLWDPRLLAEGLALIEETLGGGGLLGPYQLQAAIAAVHCEAPSVAETDWPQILGLFDLLLRYDPSPVVPLNRSVALAMVAGPAVALEALTALSEDKRIARHHRYFATRAHILELLGDTSAAATAYREAARRTLSRAEHRHLTLRAAHLSPPDSSTRPLPHRPCACRGEGSPAGAGARSGEGLNGRHG